MNTRDQFQTLLDAFGDAIVRKDHERVGLIRRTLDKKLDETFEELRKLRLTPRSKMPLPPPPRPTLPPRYTTPPPMTTSKPSAPMPPKKVTCMTCQGTGRIHNDKGFYVCRDCDGDGYKVEPSQEWIDFVMKKQNL